MKRRRTKKQYIKKPVVDQGNGKLSNRKLTEKTKGIIQKEFMANPEMDLEDLNILLYDKYGIDIATITLKTYVMQLCPEEWEKRIKEKMENPRKRIVKINELDPNQIADDLIKQIKQGRSLAVVWKIACELGVSDDIIIREELTKRGFKFPTKKNKNENEGLERY